MRSPGSSVVVCDTYAITSSTPKMRFAVVESCSTSPLTIARIASACGSEISSRGVIGPTGQNVSGDLPRVHWPSENCRSRALTSFAQR